MKALNLILLLIFSFNSFSLDGNYPDFAQVGTCVECVMMDNDNKSQGGFPGVSFGGGGMLMGGGGYGGYEIMATTQDQALNQKADAEYIKNQLKFDIRFNANSTQDLDKYIDRFDPNGEIKREEREKIVSEVIKASVMPYYKYDEKTQTGTYVVNPAIENLIQLSLSNGYNLPLNVQKSSELAQAFVQFNGDGEGMLNYLKDNYKGKELSNLAFDFAGYFVVDTNGDYNDYYNKFLTVALTNGELDDTKMMRLIRQEIMGHSLTGKPSPMFDLIQKHIDVAEAYRSSYGDNLACEFAKGIYINTDSYNETFKIGNSTYYSPTNMTAAHEVMIAEMKKTAIKTNVNQLAVFHSMGGRFDIACADGSYPLDYIEIARSEGLLDYLSEDELQSMGLIQKNCDTFASVTRLELARLCDGAAIAVILQNEMTRNERMSQRFPDSNIKHQYIEGRENCSVTVLDRIMRKAGQTVEREVEVLLNSDEVILRTKSMEDLKASINRLYGDQ